MTISGGKQANRVLHKGNIVRHFHHGEFAAGIGGCQLCPTQDMQQLQFDTLYAAVRHILNRFPHPRWRLPRQPEDRMHDDLRTEGTQILHRLFKHG